jgi:zinc D-Ala-D-Ala carboxypeptidase
MTLLTPHFTLEELTYSETAAKKKLDNIPAEGTTERANLQHLAEVMEHVRTLLGGNAIHVTSAYRSPAVNKAVGGVANSAHVQGLACDFICPVFGTPHDVCRRLQSHMKELDVDQLIHEYKTWVHIALSKSAPRNMALTIDHSGTVVGFA